jgi:perosamine synthetase
MREFRNHGITTDHRQREEAGSWFYEMTELGFNYRLTDIQCALALSQLRRLPQWVERRRAIAAVYDAAFAASPAVKPLAVRPGVEHAYHLYVVRVFPGALRVGRKEVFAALRAEGIGCNVHYIPVHMHPYYRRELGTGPGLCPVAEAAYEEILTLPLFPAMTDEDADDTIRAVAKVCEAYAA